MAQRSIDSTKPPEYPKSQKLWTQNKKELKSEGISDWNTENNNPWNLLTKQQLTELELSVITEASPKKDLSETIIENCVRQSMIKNIKDSTFWTENEFKEVFKLNLNDKLLASRISLGSSSEESDYWQCRKIPKFPESFYQDIIKNTLVAEDLRKVHVQISSLPNNSNLTSTVSPFINWESLIEMTFNYIQDASSIKKSEYERVKGAIYKWRKIKGDGNCYYRAVIIRFFELWILNNKHDTWKDIIIDIKTCFEDPKIVPLMTILRNFQLKPKLIQQILSLIYMRLRAQDIKKAYEIYSKCIFYCPAFDYGLILYFRYILYKYIQENESKLYTKDFAVSIGNLLPSQYETSNGEFWFEKFYQNYLLKMFMDAEKIVVYLTPFVLNMKIDVVLYEDQTSDLVKEFQFYGVNHYGLESLSWRVLNKNYHYDWAYNFQEYESRKDFYKTYTANSNLKVWELQNQRNPAVVKKDVEKGRVNAQNNTNIQNKQGKNDKVIENRNPANEKKFQKIITTPDMNNILQDKPENNNNKNQGIMQPAKSNPYCKENINWDNRKDEVPKKKSSERNVISKLSNTNLNKTYTQTNNQDQDNNNKDNKDNTDNSGLNIKKKHVNNSSLVNKQEVNNIVNNDKVTRQVINNNLNENINRIHNNNNVKVTNNQRETNELNNKDNPRIKMNENPLKWTNAEASKTTLKYNQNNNSNYNNNILNRTQSGNHYTNNNNNNNNHNYNPYPNNYNAINQPQLNNNNYNYNCSFTNKVMNRGQVGNNTLNNINLNNQNMNPNINKIIQQNNTKSNQFLNFSEPPLQKNHMQQRMLKYMENNELPHDSQNNNNYHHQYPIPKQQKVNPMYHFPANNPEINFRKEQVKIDPFPNNLNNNNQYRNKTNNYGNNFNQEYLYPNPFVYPNPQINNNNNNNVYSKYQGKTNTMSNPIQFKNKCEKCGFDIPLTNSHNLICWNCINLSIQRSLKEAYLNNIKEIKQKYLKWEDNDYLLQREGKVKALMSAKITVANKEYLIDTAMNELRKTRSDFNPSWNNYLEKIQESFCWECYKEYTLSSWKLPCNCSFCSENCVKNYSKTFINPYIKKNKKYICLCLTKYQDSNWNDLLILFNSMNWSQVAESIKKILRNNNKKKCANTFECTNKDNPHKIVKVKYKLNPQAKDDDDKNRFGHDWCSDCFEIVKNKQFTCRFCKKEHYMVEKY